MSVRINRCGNTVIALRRRLPPVMYNIHDTNAVCEFDHNGYYNSCTMKSCCFAGDNDQVWRLKLVFAYIFAQDTILDMVTVLAFGAYLEY